MWKQFFDKLFAVAAIAIGIVTSLFAFLAYNKGVTVVSEVKVWALLVFGVLLIYAGVRLFRLVCLR